MIQKNAVSGARAVPPPKPKVIWDTIIVIQLINAPSPTSRPQTTNSAPRAHVDRGHLGQGHGQSPALAADDHEHVGGARVLGRHAKDVDGFTFAER